MAHSHSWDHGEEVNTTVVDTDEPAKLSVAVSSPLVSPVCTTTVAFYREKFYVVNSLMLLHIGLSYNGFQDGVVYMIIGTTNESVVCLIAMSAR